METRKRKQKHARRSEMGTLSVYNQDTFNADIIQLALPQGAETYRNWQDHQHGADAFARLTLVIAMREYLVREQDTDPKKLTSLDAVYNEYLSVREYNAQVRLSVWCSW